MSLPSRRGLFCVAAALLVAGCLSPTLPLPPPGEPTVSGPDEQGLVHLSGRVRAQAWVFAVNRATSFGAFQGTGDDGRYDLAMAASVGDEILLWYEVDGYVSDSLSLTIPAPPPAP